MEYRLDKALDKNKLVQIDTQVKGKNGVFTRKQWKRAGDLTPDEAKRAGVAMAKKEDGGDKKDENKQRGFRKGTPEAKAEVDRLAKELGDDKLLQAIKTKGIQWKENANAGINKMHAKMRLREWLEDGNSWDSKAPEAPKKKKSPERPADAGTGTESDPKQYKAAGRDDMDKLMSSKFYDGISVNRNQDAVTIFHDNPTEGKKSWKFEGKDAVKYAQGKEAEKNSKPATDPLSKFKVGHPSDAIATKGQFYVKPDIYGNNWLIGTLTNQFKNGHFGLATISKDTGEIKWLPGTENWRFVKDSEDFPEFSELVKQFSDKAKKGKKPAKAEFSTSETAIGGKEVNVIAEIGGRRVTLGKINKETGEYITVLAMNPEGVSSDELKAFVDSVNKKYVKKLDTPKESPKKEPAKINSSEASEVDKYDKIVNDIKSYRSSLARSLSGSHYNGGVEVRQERDGSITLDYRDQDDRYFKSRPGEEDDDWPDFTGGATVRKIVADVFKDISKDVKIEVSPGEKSWISIRIIPKNAEKAMKAKYKANNPARVAGFSFVAPKDGAPIKYQKGNIIIQHRPEYGNENSDVTKPDKNDSWRVYIPGPGGRWQDDKEVATISPDGKIYQVPGHGNAVYKAVDEFAFGVKGQVHEWTFNQRIKNRYNLKDSTKPWKRKV